MIDEEYSGVRLTSSINEEFYDEAYQSEIKQHDESIGYFESEVRIANGMRIKKCKLRNPEDY